jgi:hypothetical protein
MVGLFRAFLSFTILHEPRSIDTLASRSAVSKKTEQFWNIGGVNSAKAEV